MHLQIDKQSDLQSIISQIKHFASKYSNDDQLVSTLIIISSEIIYNIVKFSTEGEFSLEIQNNSCIIVANDNGKGFLENAEDVLQEGYSSSGTLGLGLPSIMRLCDDAHITTSQTGTHLMCIKDF